MKMLAILLVAVTILLAACGLPKETTANPIAEVSTATPESIQALQPIVDISQPAATPGSCPLAQYRDLTVCTP